MPIYEFTCERCAGVVYATFAPASVGPPDPPPSCPDHATALRRRFSFSTPRMDHGGYDVSAGAFFETVRDRNEHYRKLSAQQTERNGYETRIVPVHPADMAAVAGVSEGPDGNMGKAGELVKVQSRRDRRDEEVTRWL